jgi:tRNA 2-selenouridine synthase SelU
MKRMFKESTKECDIIKVFDYDNNSITLYNVDRVLGCTFGIAFTQTPKQMGYIDLNDAIKKLKRRQLLHEELNIDEQIESERIGFVKLGAFRLSRNIHVDDVIEKLIDNYDMNKEEAEKQINDLYNNNLKSA